MASEQESNEFLGYTGKPLGPQLRPYDETPSLFTVILDHFFPNRKKVVAPSETPIK